MPVAVVALAEMARAHHPQLEPLELLGPMVVQREVLAVAEVRGFPRQTLAAVPEVAGATEQILLPLRVPGEMLISEAQAVEAAPG